MHLNVKSARFGRLLASPITFLAFLFALFGLLYCISLFVPAPTRASVLPTEVQEYAQDFSVSPSTAEERLTLQRKAVAIVGQLKAALHDDYAGVWFDNQAAEYVIPALRTSDKNAVNTVLADAALTGHYRFAQASSSWNDLEKAQDSANRSLGSLLKAGQINTLLDPRTNSLVVRRAATLSPAAQNTLDRVLREQGVNIEFRSVSAPDLSTRLRACGIYSGARVCDRPLRGGVSIEPDYSKEGFNYSGLCTAGFKATGNEYGNRFILTAGHCAISVKNWVSRPTTQSEKAIGTVAGYTFPGGDWAQINATGSFWDTSPWPSEVAHFWEDQERSIQYESYSYLGEYVCHSGNHSGTTCGAVSALNVTGETGAGLIYHMTEFSEDCGIEGDSGGPVFTGNTALGIYSGGSSNGHECPVGSGLFNGETGRYTEITEATSAMGVSVGYRIGGAPFVTTNQASNVSSSQATISADVNPNSVETHYHFEYGKTLAYGSSIPAPDKDVGHGTGAVGVNATLGNLEPSTIYHYRIVATSAAGTSYGGDQQFTTVNGASPVIAGEAGHWWIYFQGSEGSLRDWYYNGSSWGEWNIGGQMAPGADPAAVHVGAVWYIFYRGSDGALWYWYYNGASWSNWRLGGQMMAGTTPAASYENGHWSVYFQGSEGHLRQWYYNGSSWGEWNIGGQMWH